MSFDAAEVARLVGEANDAYLAGDYGAAVQGYEEAVAAGADGADLWFNLGNALYRAGEEGRAALAFERVLRRNPGDMGARRNLETIRSRTEAAEVAVREPFLDRLGGRVDPDMAAALLVIGWSLACAAYVVRRRLVDGAARLVAAVALGIFLAGTAAAGVATWATWQVRDGTQAVVIRSGAVRRAPDPGSPRLFTAPEGLKIASDRRIGDWAHVRLGEREGWIEAAHLEPIDLRP